ncbi:MAG: PilZ domain-containing protein, partial [Gemmatimonadota bacterium]|nr:PilZ domain-containing protein [Gemmatimonadota bacterium]
PVNIQLTQGEQVVEYSSTVIENTDSMVTLDASELGEDFKIPENAKMEVLFFRESDAGYRFNVIILDPSKLKEGKLVLKHPDDKLVRIQARSFSRMDVYFPFNYHHIPKKNFNTVEIDRNLEDCDSLPVYMADTVDISGGGLAFNTRKKLPKGHYIYLNFQNLSDQQNEPLLAQVVWSGKDKENNANLVRAKYYDITDKMRDEVMRFIYQMQRQFARRLKYAPKKR